jgi:hypothetical protein
MHILILLLMVAGACSRGETSEPVEQAAEPATEEAAKSTEEVAPEQPAEAPADAEGEQEAAPAVNLDAPPTVELLDAGKAPRKTLRATFEAGAKQSLRVESESLLTTLYGPLISTKAVMPSLVYELVTEVKETSDEGTRFELRITNATAKSRKDVKPGQLAAAEKVAASLKGVTGSFSVNARGMVEDITIDAPSDVSLIASDMVDRIEQAIRLSSLPLPEEPVGKGAKWTATQVIEQRTARFQQTSTFELVGVKGERVRAKSTQEAKAPEQKLVLPGSRSGASFTLNELDFSGESKGAWRLNQFGPVSASEHAIPVFKMLALAPKQEVAVMAVDTKLEVKATH